MSMSASSLRHSANGASAPHQRSSRPPIPNSVSGGGRTSPTSFRTPASASAPPAAGRSKTPIVYPALLSRVAEAFRERILVADRVKDGLTYKDAFDGREAVDKISYIIKTTDRNLALLLGRALDAQKFFHDVTYDHRLRDSAGELYKFRTGMPSPFVSGELQTIEGAEANGNGAQKDGRKEGKGSRPGLQHNPSVNASIRSTPSGSGGGSVDSHTSPSSPSIGGDTLVAHGGLVGGGEGAEDAPLPSGVFTLLTDCYSPTCSRDQLCYSIACPRRLEQQARLNMKPQPGLKKQISRESLGDLVVSLFLVLSLFSSVLGGEENVC